MAEIKMDTDVYSDIVGRIEQSSQELLDINDKGYIEPDEECLLNVVIPDYKVAYESLIDSIRNFQTQNTNVVDLMNVIKENYEDKIDKQKSDELKENSQYAPEQGALC